MLYRYNLKLLIPLLSYVIAQDPIVNLSQGRVVGIKVYMENSVSPIEIFYGIPYAMAPIGRLRFSTPERHPGWRRTFFAHRMPPRCPQPGNNGSDYSEDCLFLNIWTARSVAARGNLALLDQYLALVWIRENIAAFGGDPASVTLAGHSAGANSVLYHIMSPRPVGLFHRAVIMSLRDAWKLIDNTQVIDAAKLEETCREIARSLGCTGKVDREVLQCMRAHQLSDVLKVKSGENFSDYLQPIPDDFLPESEQYLPSSIAKLLSSNPLVNNPLDLLIGGTDLQSLNLMGDNLYKILIQQNAKAVYDHATTQIIPKYLKNLSLDRSESLTTLLRAITWEYWGSNSRSKQNTNTNEAVESVARMESSAMWSLGENVITTKLARQISRLYVYRYSQPSSVDLTGNNFNFSGAVYGADLIALLGDPLMLQVARRPASKTEKRISSIFRKYIVNFIKFGSPGNQVEWPRYVLEDPNVHEICLSDEVKCSFRSTGREVNFWLQYLPQLAGLKHGNEQSEQLTTEEGENRLRGGVFAMCGVSVALLLLLLASGILLHRRRTYRASISEDGTHL